MDPKLFLTVFGTVFLAELGDKTQLAALTRTAAADGSKWTVFFAASAALVVSTLVAVLIGEPFAQGDGVGRQLVLARPRRHIGGDLLPGLGVHNR